MKIKIAGFKSPHIENHPADEVKEFEGDPEVLEPLIFEWAEQFQWIHIIEEEDLK